MSRSIGTTRGLKGTSFEQNRRPDLLRFRHPLVRFPGLARWTARDQRLCAHAGSPRARPFGRRCSARRSSHSTADRRHSFSTHIPAMARSTRLMSRERGQPVERGAEPAGADGNASHGGRRRPSGARRLLVQRRIPRGDGGAPLPIEENREPSNNGARSSLRWRWRR